MTSIRAILAAFLLAAPATAWADSTNTSEDREDVEFTAAVPVICKIGARPGEPVSLELGNLADASGLLRSNLAADPQNLAGSFCNAASTITVSAEPLVAVGTRATPADGFSRRVDFTVSVTNWTDQPAIFTTSQGGQQPGAAQRQPRPRQADINLAFSNFRTPGGNQQRLIAAPAYRGTVTILIEPTP